MNLSKPVVLAGDLYWRGLNADGSYLDAGYLGPVETDQLTLQPQVNNIEQQSRAISTYGQTRSSITLMTGTEIGIQFMDLPPAIMAMLLLGDEQAISQGSGMATDEPGTAKLDKWQRLPWRNLTAGSVVITDNAGTTTYTEGTDYEVNYRVGMWRALSTGSIAQDQAVLIDAAYGAVSGSQVRIATRPQVLVELMLDGVNLDDDRPIFMQAWQAKLRPSAAVDLKSDQHWSGQLSGILITPAGKTEPGVLEYLD